jgi:S1-C subfamily serine protease
VTLFDLLIVVVGVAAAVGGYRLGFLARAASWIGLGVGLYVAARILPAIVRGANLTNPISSLLLAVLVLVGVAFAGQALGLVVGARLHHALPTRAVRDLDRGVGAGIGALGVLVLLWLLLPVLAVVPGWPSVAVRTSSISHWVDSHFPQPPNTVQELRRLLSRDGFGQVFNGITSSPDAGTAPAAIPMTPAVQARVSASTVLVQGEACGRIQDGSGFAVATDTVVTNAHVVAGEGRGRTHVMLPNLSTRPATVVLFDPERDLAILHVSGLGESPLAIVTGHVNDVGAVFGHPGGQESIAIAPAKIVQDVTAVGQDLYDRKPTRRDVYVLAANLHPGDSGGPLVNPAGAVVGVAFAIAPDKQGTTAYALTSREVDAVLTAPRGSAFSTGPCLSG